MRPVPPPTPARPRAVPPRGAGFCLHVAPGAGTHGRPRRRPPVARARHVSCGMAAAAGASRRGRADQAAMPEGVDLEPSHTGPRPACAAWRRAGPCARGSRGARDGGLRLLCTQPQPFHILPKHRAHTHTHTHTHDKHTRTHTTHPHTQTPRPKSSIKFSVSTLGGKASPRLCPGASHVVTVRLPTPRYGLLTSSAGSFREGDPWDCPNRALLDQTLAAAQNATLDLPCEGAPQFCWLWLAPDRAQVTKICRWPRGTAMCALLQPRAACHGRFA
jgi:hypothetical protein